MVRLCQTTIFPAMFHGRKIGRKGLRMFWAGQSCKPIGTTCAFLVLLVICMNQCGPMVVQWWLEHVVPMGLQWVYAHVLFWWFMNPIGKNRI